MASFGNDAYKHSVLTSWSLCSALLRELNGLRESESSELHRHVANVEELLKFLRAQTEAPPKTLNSPPKPTTAPSPGLSPHSSSQNSPRRRRSTITVTTSNSNPGPLPGPVRTAGLTPTSDYARLSPSSPSRDVRRRSSSFVAIISDSPDDDSGTPAPPLCQRSTSEGLSIQSTISPETPGAQARDLPASVTGLAHEVALRSFSTTPSAVRDAASPRDRRRNTVSLGSRPAFRVQSLSSSAKARLGKLSWQADEDAHLAVFSRANLEKALAGESLSPLHKRSISPTSRQPTTACSDDAYVRATAYGSEAQAAGSGPAGQVASLSPAVADGGVRPRSAPSVTAGAHQFATPTATAASAGGSTVSLDHLVGAPGGVLERGTPLGTSCDSLLEPSLEAITEGAPLGVPRTQATGEAGTPDGEATASEGAVEGGAAEAQAKQRGTSEEGAADGEGGGGSSVQNEADTPLPPPTTTTTTVAAAATTTAAAAAADGEDGGSNAPCRWSLNDDSSTHTGLADALPAGVVPASDGGGGGEERPGRFQALLVDVSGSSPSAPGTKGTPGRSPQRTYTPSVTFADAVVVAAATAGPAVVADDSDHGHHAVAPLGRVSGCVDTPVVQASTQSQDSETALPRSIAIAIDPPSCSDTETASNIQDPSIPCSPSTRGTRGHVPPPIVVYNSSQNVLSQGQYNGSPSDGGPPSSLHRIGSESTMAPTPKFSQQSSNSTVDYRNVPALRRRSALADIYMGQSLRKSHERGRFMTDGQGLGWVYWNILLGLFIVYESLVLPVRICFAIAPHPGWLVSDLLIDFCFVANILITFRTGFLDIETGEMVWDRRVIACRYFRGWFSLDLLSVLPVHYIMDYAVAPGSQSQFGSLPRLIRIIRLTRLVRLVRVLRLTVYIKKYANALSSSYLGVVKLLLALLMIAHLLACMWYMVASFDDFSEQTWVMRYHSDDRDDVMLLYVASLYWALTTATTVGYGDIVVATPSERILACFGMLLGSSCFGYLIANISQLVSQLNLDSNQFQAKMRDIGNYLDHRGIDPALRARVQEYLRFLHKRRWVLNEAHFLSDLSPCLRMSVMESFAKKIIKQVSIFKSTNAEFLSRVIMMLSSEFAGAEDIVIMEGDRGSEMYIIIYGTVAVFCKQEQIKTLSEGEFFGELSLLFKTPRTATIVAVTPCEFLKLTKDDLDSVLEDFPEVRNQMRPVLEKRVDEVNTRRQESSRRSSITVATAEDDD